jgi:hypothetical protein
MEFLYRLLTNDSTMSLKIKPSRATMCLNYAAQKGYQYVVWKLLSCGINVSGRAGSRGETALHLAAKNGHLSVVRTLLDGGAKLGDPDYKQRVALHQAAWSGHEGVVRLLLHKGSEVDPQDELGRTPLYGAAGRGHINVVRLLLERGANPGARGGEKKMTAMEWADKNDRNEVVEIMRGHYPFPEHPPEVGQRPIEPQSLPARVMNSASVVRTLSKPQPSLNQYNKLSHSEPSRRHHSKPTLDRSQRQHDELCSPLEPISNRRGEFDLIFEPISDQLDELLSNPW